jgi:uncharacterized protein (DUF983 family)
MTHVAPHPRIRRVFVERLPRCREGKILHGLLAVGEQAALASLDAGRSLPSSPPQRATSQPPTA